MDTLPVTLSATELVTYERVPGHPQVPRSIPPGSVCQLAIALTALQVDDDGSDFSVLLTIAMEAGYSKRFADPGHSPLVLIEHAATRRQALLRPHDSRKRYPRNELPSYTPGEGAGDGMWITRYARIPCRLELLAPVGTLMMTAYLHTVVSNTLRVTVANRTVESYRHARPD